MYLPPEVDFLHSWANFQADRLYKSNDTVLSIQLWWRQGT